MRGKVWRVPVFSLWEAGWQAACPLSMTEKKNKIKFRSSAGSTLRSQLTDARKSSYFIPGCYHLLLSLYPNTNPKGERQCVTCGWTFQLLQVPRCCIVRPGYLAVLNTSHLVVWLLLATGQSRETWFQWLSTCTFISSTLQQNSSFSYDFQYSQDIQCSYKVTYRRLGTFYESSLWSRL